MLVFDTFSDSELHGEARRQLGRLDRWFLPCIVMHEYVWALRGLKAEMSFTREKVEDYLLSEKCSFSPDAPDDLLFATREASSFARYNDCLVLSHAGRLGIPLLTFDGQLKAEARGKGIPLA